MCAYMKHPEMPAKIEIPAPTEWHTFEEMQEKLRGSERMEEDKITIRELLFKSSYRIYKLLMMSNTTSKYFNHVFSSYRW